MIVINTWGKTIHQTAHALVAAAPARAVHNEVPLRARYATTRARDLIAHWTWKNKLQALSRAHSPAGKLRAAEVAAAERAELKAAQLEADTCVDLLRNGEIRLNHADAIQGFLCDHCPETICLNADHDVALAARMSRWITGNGTAEDAAVLTAYAIDHGYKGPVALSVVEIDGVLTFIERLEKVMRDGVTIDRAKIAKVFSAAGWAPNANLEEAFDAEDARSVAGWIVGQWVGHEYPVSAVLSDAWRKKFWTVSA